MTRVKICGNTQIEDAQKAADLGADYLGLIFAESKRSISIREASRIVEGLPHYRNFVGVFFNQPKQEVETIAEELGIRFLQFHGDETALYCDYFMKKKYHVIKTFRIKDTMSLKRLEEYNVTSFLFDAYDLEEAGGTGKTFDWNLIQEKAYVKDQLFLAGGLNPENVQSAIEAVSPFAVDVASGVEMAPGKKDYQKLENFIWLVKGDPKKHAEQGSVPQ